MTRIGAWNAIQRGPDSPVLVLAHGAGAGEAHPWMVRVARGLAAHGVSVVTFEFPYMRAGRTRPDQAPVLEAAYRTAWDEIMRDTPPDTKRFAGGKSMGGRMASQVARGKRIRAACGRVGLLRLSTASARCTSQTTRCASSAHQRANAVHPRHSRSVRDSGRDARSHSEPADVTPASHRGRGPFTATVEAWRVSGRCHSGCGGVDQEPVALVGTDMISL